MVSSWLYKRTELVSQLDLAVPRAWLLRCVTQLQPQQESPALSPTRRDRDYFHEIARLFSRNRKINLGVFEVSSWLYKRTALVSQLALTVPRAWLLRCATQLQPQQESPALSPTRKDRDYFHEIAKSISVSLWSRLDYINELNLFSSWLKIFSELIHHNAWWNSSLNEDLRHIANKKGPRLFSRNRKNIFTKSQNQSRCLRSRVLAI